MDLSEVVEILRSHPVVKAAWLFGSVAQGRERPDSDLDVAVLGEAPLSVPAFDGSRPSGRNASKH